MSSPKTLSRPTARRTASPVRCVAASVGPFAHVCADLAAIDALRRNPGPLCGRELPASFLKYADEQSVCAFAAVLKAIHNAGQPAAAYGEWGVVGAPRFPGRLQASTTMARFWDQGVRGVSPHAIPQTLLHSLSGVISVGLGLGGPNLGAGGGPKALPEGAMTALALLDERRAPGLWLALSQWDPEPIPQKNGRIATDARCHAVVLALAPVDEGAAGMRLELGPSSASASAVEATPSLVTLAEALNRSSSAAAGEVIWKHSLDWGASLVLTKNAAL